MPRFRMKPIEVNAVKFDGENWVEVITFTGTRKDGDQTVPNLVSAEGLGMSFSVAHGNVPAALWSESKNYHVPVEPNVWIVRGENGYFLMTDKDFNKLYQEVESDG